MNFSPLAAMCGRVTIAEVEELVEPGELDPGHVQTPGILVQRVVVAVGIEKRIEKRTVSGLNAKNYIPVIDVVRGDGDRGSLRLVERAPRVAVADVVAATGADLRVAPDLAGGGVGHGGAAS